LFIVLYSEERQREEHRKGREREIEHVGLALDAQEGKGTKEQGYETERVSCGRSRMAVRLAFTMRGGQGVEGRRRMAAEDRRRAVQALA